MKNFLITSILAFCFLVISSCEKETIESVKSNSTMSGLSVKSNRFVFKSKEALAKFYKEYADASDEKLSQLMMPLYEKGFYSLRPIVTEDNERFVFDHYKKAMKTGTEYTKITDPIKVEEEEVIIANDYIDNLDDLEDIVGDDTFVAFFKF